MAARPHRDAAQEQTAKGESIRQRRPGLGGGDRRSLFQPRAFSGLPG
jgi:hypothetical protein